VGSPPERMITFSQYQTLQSLVQEIPSTMRKGPQGKGHLSFWKGGPVPSRGGGEDPWLPMEGGKRIRLRKHQKPLPPAELFLPRGGRGLLSGPVVRLAVRRNVTFLPKDSRISSIVLSSNRSGHKKNDKRRKVFQGSAYVLHLVCQMP